MFVLIVMKGPVRNQRKNQFFGKTAFPSDGSLDLPETVISITGESWYVVLTEIEKEWEEDGGQSIYDREHSIWTGQ